MAYMLSWDLPCLRGEEVTQKTTDEIRALLSNTKLDFESVENEALNAYLPKIFQICPFSEDVCTKKQCMDCAVFKNSQK
jgi:hypothetical protein